jgi:hypothetical protein
MSDETLRDLFAAAAMAGELAGQGGDRERWCPRHAGELAEASYIFADAMMAEREKRRTE